MNKSALALSVALALGSTSGAVWANTGIQIDPDGAGSSPWFSVDNLGSDFGDALLQSGVNAAGGNTGRLYAHNVFDLGTLDDGELSFVMWMDVSVAPEPTTVTVFGSTFAAEDLNKLVITSTGPSYFALYYDPLDGSVPGSGMAADHDTGMYYDDGILLGEGSVAIETSGGASSTTLSLSPTVELSPLDIEDCDAGSIGAPGSPEEGAPIAPFTGCSSIMSAKLNGNMFLDVEFDPSTLDMSGFLVNNLVTLGIDLEVNGGTKTPYTDVLASDVVGGSGGASLAEGSDDVNDFTCDIGIVNGDASEHQGVETTPSTVDQDCDVQYQVTSVLDFNAAIVPEPGTLGLIGAGLGLAGMFARRRKAS